MAGKTWTGFALRVMGASSMMKKTVWKVGGYNAQSASHVNCISQLHQSLSDLDEDDEYLSGVLFYRAKCG